MAFATYEKSGRVAVVTLNKPESRNAIGTQEDCNDLAAALMRAHDDRDVNAVILTGAGKAFCSGGDLKAIRERTGIGPQSTAGRHARQLSPRRAIDHSRARGSRGRHHRRDQWPGHRAWHGYRHPLRHAYRRAIGEAGVKLRQGRHHSR